MDGREAACATCCGPETTVAAFTRLVSVSAAHGRPGAVMGDSRYKVPPQRRDQPPGSRLAGITDSFEVHIHMCSLSPRGCHEGDVYVVLRFQYPDADYLIAPDPSASFTPHARHERSPLRRIA